MRVLIVNPSFSIYGGAELLVVRLANYLSQKGVENQILTTSILPEIRADLIKTGVTVVRSLPANRIGEIVALRRGIGKIEKDFDLINIHNFPAEMSVFGCGKPVVWMCNEPEFYLSLRLPFSLRFKAFLRVAQPFEKFVVRNYIKRVVVADEFNAKRFKALYDIEPEIIHYGIDCGFFSTGEPDKARDEFDLTDKFLILHIGMLTPMKNQMESLRAINTVKNSLPNAMLVLAGSGGQDYQRGLEDYILRNDLKSHVLFTGHLTRERLRNLIHASNVILHPIKEQGGWLSPFEGLCAGRPIVVSEEMTASDIIRNEGIGVVTGEYAKAIMHIHSNPARYDEMAARGAAFVRKNLSWERFSEGMLRLFCRTYKKCPG